MSSNTFFNTIVLTTAVFAALISSIANIIISLLNNYRIKKIEKQKQINEFDKYRYSRLYELLLNWNNYDTATKGETAEEIAFYRLLNLFMDDCKRYMLVKPLLDQCYREPLETKKTEGEQLLNALIRAETPDGTHLVEFSTIRVQYFDAGERFSELLKSTINNQLDVLLQKLG